MCRVWAEYQQTEKYSEEHMERFLNLGCGDLGLPRKELSPMICSR